MNEVRLTGKVLNCYIHEKTGAFICKIAVTHDHIIGRHSISCESVFNVVMQDDDKIKKLDVTQGDNVMITGYLKLDIKQSLNNNEHRKLMVYATEIETVRPKISHDIVDTTKIALGMGA